MDRDEKEWTPHRNGQMNKVRRQTMEWEKTLESHLSDKGLIFKIYNKSIHLNNSNNNNENSIANSLSGEKNGQGSC